MTSDPAAPVTLVFVGHAAPATADRAAAYEDAVLPLLRDYDARVVYRGRRKDARNTAQPFEVHVLWFPNRSALDAYLADDRRIALLHEFGEVFTAKEVVEMETIAYGPLPR
jgi:hypothetical protein